MGKCIFATLLAISLVAPVWPDEPVSPNPDAATKAEEALGPNVDLDWWSVDAGGGRSSGGSFILDASIGQADAGVISNHDSVLSGGILSNAIDLGYIFWNGFEGGDFSSWNTVVGENP